MIHFISFETGPSQSTLAKISFVNLLNSAGLDATLYGRSHWPMGKCKYDLLQNYRVVNNSVIIVDGIRVESVFDLINIDHYTFSHGRKKRILSYFVFLIRYLSHLLSFNYNYKLISYSQNKDQKKISLFDSVISDSNYCKELSLNNLVNNLSSFVYENRLYIIADITEANKIYELIISSEFNEIILASAIFEPLYFKEKIIPLMIDQKKKISIIGFQEDLSFANIDRSKPSSNEIVIRTIQKWRTLILDS